MNETRLPGQQSVRRALDVLFCLEDSLVEGRPALSAAEVGSRLGMNRTTVWRYLQALGESGLVRDLGEGRFALGGRTASLAEAYTRQWGDLEAVAGVALVRLRDEVGETAALHLRQGWARIVLRQVESRHELHRTYRDLGRPISLLTGAPSLAILAGMPSDELEAYVDAQAVGDAFEASGREGLMRELASIRDAGYAHSRGSRIPGVVSVAAVVRDSGGQVLGAINVTGPAHRLPDELVPDVADAVTAAARWIEHELVPPPPSR